MDQGMSSLILIVDDDFDAVLLVRAVLKRDGFRVDTAASIDEVLARTNDHAPDLILIAVPLLDQDGSVLSKLKEDPRTSTIPIVALTAYARASDSGLAAVAAGCCGYISKPIDTRTLGAKVCTFLPMSGNEIQPTAQGTLGC